jgi:hypothetical protein
MANSLAAAQAIPADVSQVAAHHQLGQIIAIHKARTIPPGIFPSILSLLVGIWLLSFNQGDIAVVIIGILFLGLGCWMPVRQFLNRTRRVYVFSEGLVSVKGTSLEAMQWSQVETVWQSFARYGLNILLFIPLLRIEAKSYRVKGTDGRTLVFNGILQNVEALGEAISSGTVRYLLPKAIAAYQQGAPVQFGPFTVSKQGIRNENQGIPWNLYERIMIGNGRTWIQYQGGKRLDGRVAIKNVPNFPVFIALVSYIVRGGQQH